MENLHSPINERGKYTDHGPWGRQESRQHVQRSDRTLHSIIGICRNLRLFGRPRAPVKGQVYRLGRVQCVLKGRRHLIIVRWALFLSFIRICRGIHAPGNSVLPLDDEKASDEIETCESHAKVERRPETEASVESASDGWSDQKAAYGLKLDERDQ